MLFLISIFNVTILLYNLYCIFKEIQFAKDVHLLPYFERNVLQWVQHVDESESRRTRKFFRFRYSQKMLYHKKCKKILENNDKNKHVGVSWSPKNYGGEGDLPKDIRDKKG